jgi:hypothetical protein
MKKILMAFVLMFVTSALMAQNVLEYGGGLNINKVQITSPTDGIFLSPLAQVSWDTLQFENNQLYWNTTDISINFAYLLSWGTVNTSDGSLVITPKWGIAPFIGNGLFSQSASGGYVLNKGVAGLSLAVPGILGSIMPGAGFRLDNGSFFVGAAYTTSFDVLDGFGVFKL